MSPYALRSLFVFASLTLSVAAEYSKSEIDYDFGDYRGKWCLDDHGFVYSIGEVYFPGHTACPCTCTEDGPICIKPSCPRIHPKCTRIIYKSCCPVCEAISRVCIHKGKTYRVLEEFMLSPCERCRCGANREVYCTVAECPGLHCVNPIYEPHQCCPVCKNGKYSSLQRFTGTELFHRPLNILNCIHTYYLLSTRDIKMTNIICSGAL
uniref:Si:dkey-283b1.7 n=1 Tax=Paramormyrops kingsleyae TaxID=1676925 RepID=A0A3B3RZ91_9TELE